MKQVLIEIEDINEYGFVGKARIKQWIDENHKPMIKQLNDKIKNFKKNK